MADIKQTPERIRPTWFVFGGVTAAVLVGDLLAGGLTKQFAADAFAAAAGPDGMANTLTLIGTFWVTAPLVVAVPAIIFTVAAMFNDTKNPVLSWMASFGGAGAILAIAGQIARWLTGVNPRVAAWHPHSGLLSFPSNVMGQTWHALVWAIAPYGWVLGIQGLVLGGVATVAIVYYADL